MSCSKITDENRGDITTVYCHRLLDDMDFDALHSFAYHMLRENKNRYTNEELESEIRDYYSDLLEAKLCK